MSSPPKVSVLYPRVDDVVGGTEKLADALCEALNSKGISADVVTLPYRWEPKEVIIGEALAWHMLDLDAALVIPLKFPSYFIKHQRKVPWLQHQYRQIYEFHGTLFSGFSNNLPDGELREKLAAFDTYCLAESKHIYTNSSNTLRRLQWFNGLDGAVLHPPSSLSISDEKAEYGDFILAVGRLEEIKRFDLLLRAVSRAKSNVHIKIAGTGSQLDALCKLADKLEIADQVQFLGYIKDEELAELYAHCRAVHFAPKDEDFGLIALEAMMAAKPVITAIDSGGPLDFLRDGENGFVTGPTPEAQAEALDRLWGDVDLCKRLGEAGRKSVEQITWDNAVEELCRWLP